MYYLMLPSLEARTQFIASLRSRGVQAVFDYIPLHSAPAGQKYARSVGSLQNTNATSDRLVRLVRLPLWPDLGKQQGTVIDAVIDAARDVPPLRRVAA